MIAASRDGGVSDAHKFDQFLKKLETTKQVKVPSLSINDRQGGDSSDNSTYDSRYHSTAFNESRNESSAFNEYTGEEGGQHNNERQHFETRQCFVDRRMEGPTCQVSVDSFIERAHSGQGSTEEGAGEELQLLNRNSDTQFFGEGLPDAILKLDRRDAIPTPRHKNDVLVEIEASTVDRRDYMIRPGVRCTESLPQGITTTGMDCIGRVVQLTTHARAIYGLSIDDRVAAIYPFEYKDVCKDKGRRNKRYALVDAGFVVTVPKHVDAAEASCMVRLYMSAFQSIQKGIPCLHDRYDYNQLKGQSVLIQKGQTELGRVLIEMAALLGASQIFATGEPEYHPLLMELGAIPLGLDTFGWELFIEEKISLVLVQDMPTPEIFEQYISILDEAKGNMVYIHHGLSHIDGDELGNMTDDVSCDGLHFHELAKKAKDMINSAKFSLRLACSPKYLVYEGVWPSCKRNKSQFKEDLRYLFTILGRGNLKPNVNECIGPEDLAGVQDRIELLGKNGTIVCLPTALYEKKIYHVVSSRDKSPRTDRQGFPIPESDGNAYSNSDDPLNTYASDAGYVKGTQAYDTLSDFHRMHDTRKHIQGTNISLPALPEATSYSHSNFNHRSFGALHNSSLAGSMTGTRPNQEYFPHDTSSMISSVGYSSAANVSAAQTALSDGVLQTVRPLYKEDPPQSIQFRKQSRRYRALRARAKERRKREQQQKKMEENEKRNQPLPLDDLSDGSNPSQDKSASSPVYSARRLRREARKREKRSLASGHAMEEKRESRIIDAEAVHAEPILPQIEQASAAAVRVTDEKDEKPVSNIIDANENVHGAAGMPDTEQTGAPACVMDERPVTKNIQSEANIQKREQNIALVVSVVEENPMASNIDASNIDDTVPNSDNKIVDANAVDCEAKVLILEHSIVPAVNETDGDKDTRKIIEIHDREKPNKRPKAARRPVPGYRSEDVRYQGHTNVLQDSRNEVDECARDSSTDNYTRASSFNTLMQKWKSIDNRNRHP